MIESREKLCHMCLQGCAHLDAVRYLPAVEDALLGEAAMVRQRVQVDAEEVLALQHSHALRVGAESLRQLQPLRAALAALIACAQGPRALTQHLIQG